MEEWNTGFHAIGIRCVPRLIQVRNDEALRSFLNEEGVGSMELALKMKEQYREAYGEDIHISEKSLAVEILGHVFADDFAEVIKRLPISGELHTKGRKLAEALKERTEIIDCGEASVDPNRKVWDALQHISGLIFLLSGKKA